MIVKRLIQGKDGVARVQEEKPVERKRSWFSSFFMFLFMFGLMLLSGGDLFAQGSVPGEVQTVLDNVNATTALVFAAIGVAVAFMIRIRWVRRIK